MPRVSRHLDRKLLATARALLVAKGVSKLNVRELCELAEVNLGMFHYHFGTKDEFCRIALQDFYEEVFGGLAEEAGPFNCPLAGLRSVLYILGTRARDHGAFFMAQLADLKMGEKIVIEFFKKNSFRHPALIRDLILQCQKQKLIVSLPFEQVMALLVGAVAPPGVMLSMADALAGRKAALALRRKVLSDEAIRQRVDMALKGVSL